MNQIHNKIIACMREVEAIGKNKRNQQQGFSYRGIDDVYNALNPILSKHGVFTAPEVTAIQRETLTNAKGTTLHYSIVTMKHKFYAEDGSCVETTVIGEGMDSGDKATNKAMAIAHKYALFQIFCIPTEDMPDPDAESHEAARPVSTPPPPLKKLSAEQAAALAALALMPDKKERLDKALAFYYSKQISDLNEHQAETILKKLTS